MKSELSGRPANELKGYESKISISKIHLYGLTHKAQNINTINMVQRYKKGMNNQGTGCKNKRQTLSNC